MNLEALTLGDLLDLSDFCADVDRVTTAALNRRFSQSAGESDAVHTEIERLERPIAALSERIADELMRRDFASADDGDMWRALAVLTAAERCPPWAADLTR